jgi:hypothetical protein
MSFANSYMWLGLLTVCYSINRFCSGGMCIKNDSQIFILTLLLQGFNSSIVCSVSIFVFVI